MFDLAPLFTAEGLISLLTLTLLEVVLGIDNIVFISILSGKLPPEQEAKARKLGLALALIARVALLFGIVWIISLQEPLFTLFNIDFSVRDIILFAGGLFLLYKSTTEIHVKLEGEEHRHKVKAVSFTNVIIQIILLDMVFSIDSILTAIGLVDTVLIMVIAVVVAIGVMFVYAGRISRFIHKHPTLKMLALSFLLMIGLLLVVEAFHVHVPKGYVYFAMGFSIFVEMLNLRMRKSEQKVDVLPDENGK